MRRRSLPSPGVPRQSQLPWQLPGTLQARGHATSTYSPGPRPPWAKPANLLSQSRPMNSRSGQAAMQAGACWKMSALALSPVPPVVTGYIRAQRCKRNSVGRRESIATNELSACFPSSCGLKATFEVSSHQLQLCTGFSLPDSFGAWGDPAGRRNSSPARRTNRVPFSRKNPISFARVMRPLNTVAPDASTPCAWKTCFAISPIVLSSSTGAASQMVGHHHLGT